MSNFKKKKMKNIQFIQLTPEQLTDLISSIITPQIEEIKNCLKQQVSDDALLTRAQTCELLQIDSSTLWNWSKKGRVTVYGIGNRRYYKKAELLASLVPMLVSEN
jgi:hypothetical protein